MRKFLDFFGKNSSINKKKVFLYLFITCIVMSLVILFTITFLQDNLFLEFIKSISYELDQLNVDNSELSSTKNALLPIISSYRHTNSMILYGVGFLSIIISLIATLLLIKILSQYFSKITENRELRNSNNGVNKSEESTINDDSRVKNSINYEGNVIELNNSVEKYEQKIENLENQNVDLLNKLQQEKEKNEILFSQIEKVQNEYNNIQNDNSLSEEEKTITNLLNKVLDEEEDGNINDNVEENSINENRASKKIKTNTVNNNNNNYKEKSNRNEYIQKKIDPNSTKSVKDFRNYRLNKIYDLVKSLCRKKEYEKALDVGLSDLNQEEQKIPKFAYLFGYIYAKLNENRNSKKYLINVLSTDPNNIEARNLLGVIQYRLGDKVGAKQHFKRVLLVEPHNKVAKENLKRINNIEKNQKSMLNKIIA